MIKYTPASEIDNQLFATPFDQVLQPTNRWVILRGLIPWDDLAAELIKTFKNNRGRSTVDIRYVLGALIIQGMENLTDEQTIESISENVYLQYFIGLPSFCSEPLFTPEVLCYTRSRLGKQGSARLNEVYLKESIRSGNLKHRKSPQKRDTAQDTENQPPCCSEIPLKKEASTHKGVLKVDATASPASIKYPYDTNVLDDCRLTSEEIIDIFWKSKVWTGNKPRTYRRKLKAMMLDLRKKKHPTHKQIRQVKRKLLLSLKRNIAFIDKALDSKDELLRLLTPKQYRNWLVIQEVYRQQEQMYSQRSNRISDRIVSLSQPWIRAIPRGKPTAKIEFGAQINMSETNGYVLFNQVDFNKFNEGTCLIEQVEDYKNLLGYYPESLLADKIFLNRSNRKWLKEKGIEHYGSPLGRPPQLSQAEKRRKAKKQNKRSEIEGKFGQAKMRFGMDRIRTRGYAHSLAKIGLIALILNIWKRFQIFFSLFTHFWSLCRATH